MSDSSNFDNEKFLAEIHTIPFWVKNGDDLLKFCKHLHYRLLQEKAVSAWYERNFKLDDDKCLELSKILCSYDKAYNSDLSEFRPFD